MKMKTTHDFRCDQTVLWDCLNDPEKQQQWMTGLEECIIEQDTGGVGTRFRSKIREGKRLTEYTGETTIFEPERHLQVELVGGCGKTPMTMLVDYELEPRGEVTRLHYTWRSEMDGIVAKIMGPTLGRVMGMMMVKKFMRNLRAMVEQPSTTTAT